MSKRPMDILTLAAATGSTGGLGKITTEHESGALQYLNFIMVQTYIAQSNVLGATITGADATAIDDGDNFVLNGLTFTAESTEGDASAAARKFWTGANNAAAVTNSDGADAATIVVKATAEPWV